MASFGTPNNLEILIHYYVCSEPHPRIHAPAVREGIAYLTQHGLLDRADFPRCTDKGEFLLWHLLKVPFPVQKWEIPNEGDAQS